jgi:hypothetical protein
MKGLRRYSVPAQGWLIDYQQSKVGLSEDVFPASMLLLPVAYTVAPQFESLPGLDGATCRTPFLLARCPMVTRARKCFPSDDGVRNPR